MAVLEPDSLDGGDKEGVDTQGQSKHLIHSADGNLYNGPVPAKESDDIFIDVYIARCKIIEYSDIC